MAVAQIEQIGSTGQNCMSSHSVRCCSSQHSRVVLKSLFAHYYQSQHTLTFLCSAVTETSNVKHQEFKACCTRCCKSMSFVDGVLKFCFQLHLFRSVKYVICMLLTGGYQTLFGRILYPTATLFSGFSTLFYIMTLLHLHWEVK